MSRTLSLSTQAFSSGVFLPVKLSGTERINELFTYQLILKTPNLDSTDFYRQFGTKVIDANADLTSWLGQNLTINIEIDGKDVTFSEVNNTFHQHFTKTVGKGTRYISGIITSARYLYNNERSSYYSIELRPFLYNATLKSDYKIFQNKNVIEILDEVLSAYSGTVEKRLWQEQRGRYPIRIYQNQHGETDYQFFCRLCSEFGVNHFFSHTDNNHTLILSDEPYGHYPIQNEAYQKIAYYPLSYKDQTHIKEEHLHEFNLTAQMVSGAYASADYNYTKASATILDKTHNTQPYPEAQKEGVSTQTTDKTDKKAEQYPEIAQYKDEIYEYAADIVQAEADVPRQDNDSTSLPLQGGGYTEEHQLRNQWNLERLQQSHFNAKASGHIRGITTGYTFELEKHPNKLANIKWTVLGTELLVMDVAEETQRTATQNKLEKLTDTTPQQWRIECSTDLIPANIPVRPPSIAKPKASLQNALVVGEGNHDALYVDVYGRIKVQFYWDRYGQRDENSSCWVRVNEPWAGNQMGAVFTPRIGQEVLISYVNNDPDLPVCIGKVNNSNNLPNWQLPQNKALSGFRSREMPQGNSSSGRSNHLVFDDSAGTIQTQLKSDHAHSQLSLGDITRIEDNAGRKDARGQGFELRTDDWGATRAAKGLYLTTYARNAAESTHMDAFEAQQLLEEARQLVKQLSKLANQHQAEPLSGTEPLGLFSKLTQSELPDSIGSVLSGSLPDKVKAQVSENILKNLAKQEAIPPLEPIGPSNNPLANSNNIGDLINQYAKDKEYYHDALKAFENNPYDKARQKLEELNKISNPQEKTKALLQDQEITGLFQSLKKGSNAYYGEQDEEASTTPYSPKGFEENILVGAGEAGIALVTPRDTHQYSSEKHTITAGQDLNVTTGQSWLASIQNKMSFFVQQGVKIFSSKGKIQIQANRNNIEIIADKTLKVISANDKVEVIAKKEILITCDGAYIRIKDGNIEIHAPGKVEHKAAQHPFRGPTSLPKEMPRLPTSELNIKNQFALVDNFYGVRMPNQKYKVTLEDGTVYQGKSNDKGETEIIESHIPQKAKVEILDNQSGRMFSFGEYLLTVDNSNYDYRADEILVASTENISGGLPKNDSYCSTDKVKLRSVAMADYDFGLRLVESCPKDKEGNEWRYPVAEDYYRSICTALENTVNWAEMCVEIDKLEKLEAGVESGNTSSDLLKKQQTIIKKDYYTDIAERIKSCCHEALQSSKASLFNTPVSFPKIPGTSSREKIDPIEFEFHIGEPPEKEGVTSQDNFNYDKNSSIAGIFTHGANSLHMSINPKFIHRFAQLKVSDSPEKMFDLIGCRSDLIGIMYHETRHYQQFFWATVYGHLYPEDFFQNADANTKKGFLGYLNAVMPVHLAEYVKKHESRLKEALTCQGNNHLKVGLRRILVASLYRARLTKEAEDEGRLTPFQQAIVQLAERVFKQPGEGGESINYRLFHEYGLMSTGYYLNPYEDDAHATQELIIYYEKTAFGKMAEPYNIKVINRKNYNPDDLMYFTKKVTKASWVPDKLPKPTDHNIMYPKSQSRNAD